MKRLPALYLDPATRRLSDDIQDLIDRIDDLIAQPDPEAEARLIADVDAMKRDLNAELIRRNPPPGWEALEQRVSGIVH